MIAAGNEVPNSILQSTDVLVARDPQTTGRRIVDSHCFEELVQACYIMLSPSRHAHVAD